MASDHIRRWESGALAHAVTDPFGQGPVPWLRGSETYFDDTGHVVPWYVDPSPQPLKGVGSAPRVPGPRSADDVHRQIKGFTLYATRTILSGQGSELIELTRTNLRQLETE